MKRNNIGKFGAYAAILAVLVVGYRYYRKSNETQINSGKYISQEMIYPDWIEQRKK